MTNTNHATHHYWKYHPHPDIIGHICATLDTTLDTWVQMTEDEQLSLVCAVANSTLPASEAILFVLEWMDLPVAEPWPEGWRVVEGDPLEDFKY